MRSDRSSSTDRTDARLSDEVGAEGVDRIPIGLGRGQSRPVGSVLGLWAVVVGGIGFVAGLVGVVFSTFLWWDESYAPPSCFELSNDYNAVLAVVAVCAGPVLTGVAVLGGLSKRLTRVDTQAMVAADLLRLAGVAMAVVAMAPVFAYVLVDVAYRLGVRPTYVYADRATCIGQLMPTGLALTIIALAVAGVFALGRTLVRYR